MKLHKALYILPLLLFSFCGDKASKNDKTTEENTTEESAKNLQEFVIEGKVKNYKTEKLILNELSLNGGIPLDTALVDDNGNFTFKGFIREKTYAMINFGQYRNVFFVVDTASKINVEINADGPITYTVNNSPASEEIQKIANLNSTYNQKIMDLQTKAQANPTMGMAERQAIEQEIGGIVEELKAKAKLELAGFKQPFAKIFAVEMLQVEADKEIEESILKETEEVSNKWVTLYRPKAQSRIQTAVGAVAPDFTLNTPQGEQLSLSSLRGKYVLVDFWASWCKPCRIENPNVVKMYNKYKSEGFEILGVSLDQDGGAWKQAIAQDNLTWKHVSDLGGWQSSAAQLYGVKAIPQTLLLDKEGKIIAKNLRGQQLEEKLATLFK